MLTVEPRMFFVERAGQVPEACPLECLAGANLFGNTSITFVFKSAAAREQVRARILECRDAWPAGRGAEAYPMSSVSGAIRAPFRAAVNNLLK